VRRIIQIGVERANDHVFEIIKNYEDEISAYFVEPNPHCIPIINQKYSFLKNKVVSNIVISEKNGCETMYFPPWYTIESNVASLNPKHLVNHGVNENSLVSIEVKSLTLNSYIEEVGIKKEDIIDNLFIDTEGYDCDIILSTNFKNNQIRNICFEYIHSDDRQVITEYGGPLNTPKFLKTNDYLLEQGYVLDRIEESEHNIYYRLKEKNK